jgi:phage-related holin
MFDNLLPLFIAVIVFEVTDFVTGVIKSGVVSKRKGGKFAFESVKAWRTIYKFVLILVGIVLAELLDQTFGNDGRLKLANYFTAFCCGVEFWSFLENAAVICDHPIFRMLKKVMREKVEDEINATFEDEP